MRQRGRRSGEALGIAAVQVNVRTRPDPPEGLNSDEEKLWREITEALRPDWFEPETVPLLAQYVRHAVLAANIGKRINLAGPIDREFIKLARLHLAQTAALIRLATKLRLTIQSSTDSRTSKHVEYRGPKPWDYGLA